MTYRIDEIYYRGASRADIRKLNLFALDVDGVNAKPRKLIVCKTQLAVFLLPDHTKIHQAKLMPRYFIHFDSKIYI